MRITGRQFGARLVGAASGFLDDVLYRLVEHIGLGEAGADRVDGYALARQFQRQRPGQPDKPVFRCAIGGDITVAGKSGGRGDIDDAPIARVEHRRHYLLGAKIGARQVEGNRGVPLLAFEARERCAGGAAGVVDQNFRLRDPLSNALERRNDGSLVGHVSDYRGDRDLMSVVNIAGSLLEGIGAASDQCQIGAQTGQFIGDRRADAARPAGDNGVLAGQRPGARRTSVAWLGHPVYAFPRHCFGLIF